MKQEFIPKDFKAGSLKVIEQANVIIGEYQRSGYSLTLRQLYYQFVARGIIPNRQTEYKRLGSIVNDARLAGLIDWSAIEDRTRYLRAFGGYKNPADYISGIADGYVEDPWADQDNYCEVWIEKDALVGVVERPCGQWRVPYFACRGYASQSELYAAGKRLERKARLKDRVVVFHLGDHDPSGLDMTRDNESRLDMFARLGSVEVIRLALNWDQVQEYNPPPNPAKESDSRAEGYIAQYGESSWELDALDPSVIADLVEEAIKGVLDVEAFEASQAQEEENRAQIQRVAERWDDIEAFFDEGGDLGDDE
jgi:hypothetical protein